MVSESAVVIEATRWRYVAKFAGAVVAGVVCWAVTFANLIVPGATPPGKLLNYIVGDLIFSIAAWYLYKEAKSPPKLIIDPDGFRVIKPRKTTAWNYADVTDIRAYGASILIGAKHFSFSPNSIDLEFTPGSGRVADALRTAMAKKSESEGDFRRSVLAALQGGDRE